MRAYRNTVQIICFTKNLELSKRGVYNQHKKCIKLRYTSVQTPNSSGSKWELGSKFLRGTGPAAW